MDNKVVKLEKAKEDLEKQRFADFVKELDEFRSSVIQDAVNLAYRYYKDDLHIFKERCKKQETQIKKLKKKIKDLKGR